MLPVCEAATLVGLLISNCFMCCERLIVVRNCCKGPDRSHRGGRRSRGQDRRDVAKDRRRETEAGSHRRADAGASQGQDHRDVGQTSPDPDPLDVGTSPDQDHHHEPVHQKVSFLVVIIHHQHVCLLNATCTNR